MVSKRCIIFNPSARGDKARRFQNQLGLFAREVNLMPSDRPGMARTLARIAIENGFETIIAAGGDGTINEVVNGMGDAHGFEKARLGVLPLGTINVFAKELLIPGKLSLAWELIETGHQTRVDLGVAEYSHEGALTRRYFAQLAGCGLDAKAVKLVSWELKKKIGAGAYVLSGFHALGSRQPTIRVSYEDQKREAELVLVGNGAFYGGKFKMFPRADLRNGLLEVRLITKANLGSLCRLGWGLLISDTSQPQESFSVSRVQLTSETYVPLQLDGELVGELPATLWIAPKQLAVIVGKSDR